jgi:uncharacterized delta-60 repeat protein
MVPAMGEARRIVAIASLLGALLPAATTGSAQAYRFVPDPTFGSAGVANLLAVNQPGGIFRRVREVEPGPAGTVWVHYRDLAGPEQYECEALSYLARYLPDGSLDTSFGVGGFAPIASPIGCRYPTLSVDRQLRPLVTWTSDGGSQAPSTMAIARYTTAGGLDPTFGSGGVVLLTIPCPGGSGADPHSDSEGNLLLSFGCRADESARGWMGSPFQSYLARLLADGALDTGFGSGGFLTLPQEAGWEPPVVAAVEVDGSAILSQTTQYVTGVPQRSRLLRLRPDGVFASGYQLKAERSLRRVAALAAPRIPEEVTDFVLRPDRDLVVSGRSDRGGWVATLRHDGSLERGFSDDGYRRFPVHIQYIAADPRERLFALGDESRRLTFFRLLADGSRDRSVGGREGQCLGMLAPGAYLRELVSNRHGLPLLYFTNLGSCTSPQSCDEPAELRRYRFNGKQPRG